jgi:hypothetical protein
MELESIGFGVRIIDARPSDAIAVALRMKAPILVSSNIMEEAGVDQDSIKEVKKTIIKPEISVQNLKEKLKLAVEEEEYETAAILRDKISLLEP